MVKTDAFANTKEGTLQGICVDGVYRFLGIRYCQPPVGENRWMPPKPVTPWQGVKPALEYAAKCWQCDNPLMENEETRRTKYPSAYEKLMTGSTEMGVGYQSEDCCALNIWTQGLNDGKKRPVLIWLHGGGNICGGTEADWHDGFNLAKNEDIIFVTIGHRLGIFGYLYLCDLDEKYKNSANLGHQDMAFALQWIHDNIEAFGGDPDNVTVCGQSGGGEKVASVISMPMCRGNVHKGIIQSGGFMARPISAGQEMTRQLLDYLKIDKDNLDKLYDYSGEDLINIQRAINKTRPQFQYFECPVVMDGRVIKYNPFDGAEGSEYIKDIPVINGYTADDAVLFSIFSPQVFDSTEEQAQKLIEKMGYTAEQAVDIMGIYRKLLGEDTRPVHLYTSFMNDRMQNRGAHDRGLSRFKVGGGAPYYTYCFTRPGNDPDLRAIHGVEIPFAFGNADYAPALWNCDTHTDAMKVNKACSAAWAAFARTGNPSNPYMPVWKPFEEDTRYTMLIDVDCKLVSNYHKEIYDYAQIK